MFVVQRTSWKTYPTKDRKTASQGCDAKTSRRRPAQQKSQEAMFCVKLASLFHGRAMKPVVDGGKPDRLDPYLRERERCQPAQERRQ